MVRTQITTGSGNRVRELRQRAGFSQEEFAAECNLDRTYISTLLEHRVAGVESQQHPTGGTIHLGMHDTVLTSSDDIAHDSIERTTSIDGIGSGKIIHRGDHLFGYAMHIDEHDSIQRSLTRRDFLAAGECAPDLLKRGVSKAPRRGQSTFRESLSGRTRWRSEMDSNPWSR
jgi:Helix-turn-helix